MERFGRVPWLHACKVDLVDGRVAPNRVARRQGDRDMNVVAIRSFHCGRYALRCRRSVLTLYLLLGAVSACQNEDYAHARGEAPGPVGSLRDLLHIVDSLRIEESPASLVVNPFVTSDSAGFLVADMSEGQIRRYGRDGRLRWTAGQKGWGPGELQLPAQAVSVGEHEYVVVDGRRGILDLSRDEGSGEWRTVSTALGRPFQVAVLGGGTVLVAGYWGNRPTSDRAPLMHFLDMATGAVDSSIVPMPGTDLERTTALNAGVVAFAAIGDTLLLTVGAIDTVYRYLMSGTRLSATAIASKHFQKVALMPGSVPRQMWRESFSRHRKIYALTEGRVLVSHVRLWSGEHVWGTVVISHDGSTLLDVLHREPLLTVLGDTLVFGSGIDPARWYLGTIPGWDG